MRLKSNFPQHILLPANYCLSRQHPATLTLNSPVYRWFKPACQMDPRLPFRLERRAQRERGRERGWSSLAIPRHFNGVFHFAVAGNERKLKPGQLFIPEKRSRLEEKAEERWRVALDGCWDKQIRGEIHKCIEGVPERGADAGYPLTLAPFPEISPSAKG